MAKFLYNHKGTTLVLLMLRAVCLYAIMLVYTGVERYSGTTRTESTVYKCCLYTSADIKKKTDEIKKQVFMGTSGCCKKCLFKSLIYLFRVTCLD